MKDLELPRPISDQVTDVRALIIRRAILAWTEKGIKVNRAYTPKNMAAAAAGITGLEYTSSKKSLKKAANDIAAMYPGICT